LAGSAVENLILSLSKDEGFLALGPVSIRLAGGKARQLCAATTPGQVGAWNMVRWMATPRVSHQGVSQRPLRPS
jgi:hypothetical protein